MPDRVPEIEDHYPLSPMQQGMLFNSLYAPQSGVDVEQLLVTWREAVHVPAVWGAWQQVAQRYAPLRTRFDWRGDGEPRQIVQRAVTLACEQHDWRALPAHARESRLSAYLQVDRRRGFDFGTAPPWRLALLRFGAADYRLLWTFHHALLDGRSIPSVLGEAFRFYAALRDGHVLHLDPPRPYRLYVDWLRQQDVAQAEGFWRQQLAGFSAATPLPTGLSARAAAGDGAQGDGAQGECGLRLPERLSAGLQALAREYAVTLNTLVQGAWALLLSRYSGEQDVLFAATRACRRSGPPGAESLVGMLINTLPVRVAVRPATRLREWLQALRAQQVALRAVEHTPLVSVLGWSEIPAGQPLFESLLVFENYQLPALLRAQDGAWAQRDVQLFEQTNYPLTLAGYAGDTLLLKLNYEVGRFSAAQAARLLDQLQTLLGGMRAAPDARLSDLPLLSQAERHQVLVEWNPPTAEPAGSRDCLPELFAAQAERTPHLPAVCYGQQVLTYRELDLHSNQLAHALRARGVRAETIVATCLERSPQMIVALLAIWKAGGAYLPLDPQLPPLRLAALLDDSRPPFLLTQQSLLPRLSVYAGPVLCLDRDEGKWIAGQSPDRPAGTVLPGQLAYVLYTSGSTGHPKGVLIEHRALGRLAHAQARAFGVEAGSRVLQFASPGFDASIAEICVALLAGAALVLATPEALQPGPALMRLLRDEAISVVTLPPSLLAVLPDEPLPELRTVIAAGEACPAEVARRWAAGRRFVNAYGPTEATVCVTLAEAGADAAGADAAGADAAGAYPAAPPIGRPLPHARVYLLDGALQPVPAGAPGELYAGGDGLARGYLNRPDLTSAAFVPNPFSEVPGARLYRSGDLARYLADGQLEFLGRGDRQIKRRGVRVELGEIEAALNAHPAVCAVLVLADNETPGAAGPRLVAYAIPVPGAALAPEDLRRFLKERLPAAFVPDAYRLLPRWPLTPNGKIDRTALPGPEPEQPATDAAARAAAPRNPIEARLATLFQEVLVLAGPVGAHDHFFELGGHSLLAAQLIARVQAEFQQELSLRELFVVAPTVAELAELIVQRTLEQATAAELADALGEVSALSDEEVLVWLGSSAPGDSAPGSSAHWPGDQAG